MERASSLKSTKVTTTKESMSTTKSVGSEFISGRVETNILDNISMISGMVMGKCSGRTEPTTVEFGKKAFNMVRERFTRMVRLSTEYLKTIVL